MPTSDTIDLTRRQLAELQRTLATKATQLEQLVLDISRLVGEVDPPVAPSPWAVLLDPGFREAWRARHRDELRGVIGELEEQAAHVGDLRRHLLPTADDPAAAR